MEKIDRLGWAVGLSFESYGVKVGVRANSREALEMLLPRLPAGWRPVRGQAVGRLYSFVVGGEGARPGVRRFSLLFGDVTRLARTLDVGQLLDTFESDLRLHVAEWSRRRLFVHAGVVGWKGCAVVIPGRSFSGKTTLVAELVRAGAEYYSDEYAAFDSRGRVHPFPKPLAIREAGAVRQRNYDVEELGGRAGVRPLPVGLVVASSYREGSRWRPVRLSEGQGVLSLLANTVAARRRPADALATFRRVVAAAPVIKGTRGEAREVAESILANL